MGGELDTKSLVEIVFLLIKRVKEIEKEEKIHFDYYLLLSGQDYLTKPICYINAQLKKSYPKPFIDCTPYDKSNWIYYKFNSIFGIRNFQSWVSEKFPKKGIRHLFRLFFRGVGIMAEKIVQFFHKTDYDYIKKKGVTLYGGSAWWILPDIVIDFIMQERVNNADWFKCLLNSYTPEETFFQTLSMRSPIKELIELNPIDWVAQNCKTWAYFSDIDKPFKGHPYIFTENEYNKLIKKGCWIARKFDITISSKIFDLLDKYMENAIKWSK